MKKTIYLLGICFIAVIAASSPVHGAPLLLPPADAYYTSFEDGDNPSYIEGKLDRQNGWLVKGSSLTAAAQIVLEGNGGTLASPDGSQMLALQNAASGGTYGGSPKAYLQFASTPYTDSLYFSGVTAFSGTLSEQTGVISRFYLNDTNEFNGVIFGLHKDGDDVRFFYNDGNTAVSFGDSVALIDTFYRFELDIDIAAKRFDIRVFDFEDNTLLGTAQNAAFRGNTTTISFLRLNNLSNPSGSGDDFVTYYDQIWINTAAIPEPSMAGLLLAGAVLTTVTLSRQRNSVARD